MKINISVKQIGRKNKKIDIEEFDLPILPANVSELIKALTIICVTDYNDRLNDTGRVLSSEEINSYAEIGKIAFGVNYNGNHADKDKAVANALQGFEDGLYRIFLDDSELTSLSQEISLSENSIFTFIRLTMLTGRLW